MAEDPTTPDGEADATEEDADGPPDEPRENPGRAGGPDDAAAGEPSDGPDDANADPDPADDPPGPSPDGTTPSDDSGADTSGAPEEDDATNSEPDDAAGVEGADDSAVADDVPGAADDVPGAADDEPADSDDEPAAADAGSADQGGAAAADAPEVPADVRKYARFKKVDGAQYDRVNDFLRERTYVTAREWAIARLCADFRTETGVEMTKIGENLPELVPFMEDTYSPQAVNQARSSFEEKVQKAGATFLYGAMCDFFTAEELDELMYEVTEVAKFLLEVEGVDLTVDEELEAEDRISGVMREVREASEALRYEECPHCGEQLRE